jgi:hypothetical protein
MRAMAVTALIGCTLSLACDALVGVHGLPIDYAVDGGTVAPNDASLGTGDARQDDDERQDVAEDDRPTKPPESESGFDGDDGVPSDSNSDEAAAEAGEDGGPSQEDALDEDGGSETADADSSVDDAPVDAPLDDASEGDGE